VSPTPVVAAAPAAEVGRARPSERRIVLDAEQPTFTIPAAERRSGALRITLQWEQQVTSAGLHRSSDVHLGCLWETRDRHAGALQSLGELLAAPGFGARQVLRLGPRSEQGGEEVLADTAHLELLRRMVFYAYAVGPQPPDYQRLAPHLTLARRGGGTLQMWTGEPPEGARTCVIASVHDVGGDLVVRRENEFFTGPVREVALAYGFDDLDWNHEGTVPRPS
jgi:tellurite resistance protein TerA